MSVVKIQNKKALEQLQAKLTLRIGRKPTQQEILDYCVYLANENFDQLVDLITSTPVLNQQRVEQIIEKRNKLTDVIYDKDATFKNQEDQDIYSA